MGRSCDDIRKQFIEFFQQRGHTFVPSSPLLPGEDPTLLFTNAGMNQFKDIFLGAARRDYVRAANTQKCIRAGGKHNDLEDVGHDTYHHTFFEMLGNWSFGDYFKAEAIAWAWELLTGVWGLDKSRLHATVFGGDAAEGLAADEEAERLWREATDIDPSHVHRGGKKDNFWEMGETGPCGPCSEIHIDLTDDRGGAKLVNAGDARVMEIWNLVFMQFSRAADGKLSPLPARHVDTGMGLERICMVLAGKRSNYATDLFVPIIERIETLTKHRYGGASALPDRFDVTGEADVRDVACRVIADHARALVFAIADGVVPSNEGRGYVLRRILRRAARYGRQYLDIAGPFLVKLVPTVVELMGGAFGELRQRQDYVAETIRGEEESFGRTLDRGIELFQKQVDTLAALVRGGAGGPGGRVALAPSGSGDTNITHGAIRAGVGGRGGTGRFPGPGGSGGDVVVQPTGSGNLTLTSVDIKAGDGGPGGQSNLIPGELVFELYATYGFPVDLTQIMAAERGLEVDLAGYEEAMQKHRQLSGAGKAFQAAAALDLPPTDDGAKYRMDPIDAKVLGWVIDGRFVADGRLEVGQEVGLVLDRTNFYAEQGGQVGDTGVIAWEGGKFAVGDTQLAGSGIVHLGAVEIGTLGAGQAVRAQVDPRRLDIMRNHTGTHLLNWALREVLGEHVNQAGSVVAPDRLRFDFSHNQAVKAEQLAAVERLANERILADEPVEAKVLPLAEAKKIPGVRAVFGEKYPDPVRVIVIGQGRRQSAEFCGGAHLGRTAQIGLLKIIAEESVAKGVRRITALTGRGAVAHVQQLDEIVRAAAGAVKTAPAELPDRIAAMQKELKDLRKGRGGGGPAAAAPAGFQPLHTVESPAGKVLVGTYPSADAAAMRSECDRQRQKGAAALLLGAAEGAKVMLVAMVSEELAGAGRLRADEWVRAAAPVVGGSGGGRPTLAQAGGKLPDKLPDALAAAAEFARKALA